MATTTEPLGEAQIRALADRYRISLEVSSAAGTIGSRAGRETGASVEIQDFRDYVPGDDPRRIDWLAYGRTDRLVVRLFREEVSPFFDVLVDTSESMVIPDGRKAALSRELCGWLYHSAHNEGIAVRLFSAGENVRRVEEPGHMRFDQPESALFAAPGRASASLRRASVRLLLSDFMDPADPSSVLRPLASGCTNLVVVHLLGPWEADPDTQGPAVLHCTETDRKADINLNAKAVQRYRKRLEALTDTIRDECYKCGGLYLQVVADRDLEQVLKEDFLEAGLLEAY